MKQEERIDVLLEYFLGENPLYMNVTVPDKENDKKELLRGLFNIRKPDTVEDSILKIQDEYLKEETANKGITDIEELELIQDQIYLWKGDITTLKVDAIVNAANSEMLGCFIPSHGCIDNAIHTFAGVQLRIKCAEVMDERGRPEPTGTATITDAFNLPGKYVIHTVGPVISGELTTDDCNKLESCYRSCLSKATENGLKSIAFCCISTGEFHFPNDIAAEIATNTVERYIEDNKSDLKVVFNVFKGIDYELYDKLLK